MGSKSVKYPIAAIAAILCGQMVFGTSLTRAGATGARFGDTVPEAVRRVPTDSAAVRAFVPDTAGSGPAIYTIPVDSLPPDTLAADSLPADTAAPEPFLDDIISGNNRDSLVYDLRNKTVHIYNQGDVTYQNINLKADYMVMRMDDKTIYAKGVMDDSTGRPTRPELTEGESFYSMDSVNYNINTKKAKVYGLKTQEGEGFMIGRNIKKMPDNTMHAAHGMYTTCDLDHPHFYIEMTKAKMIPGKKVIMGPAYFVMEDVPLYPLMLPFGFFPIQSSRSSGFIVPSYGEEYVKGFFLRDGGYYFAFNDYIDLTVLGGWYTLGSWQASIQSRYLKRYKYSGNFSMRFSKDIIGEKGAADYVNMNNLQVTWNHTQDPKFRPNSTFSASVNFSTSGYSKYGTSNLNDYLNTQTNSSISYSKTWPGKPFSFSTNMQHSQNSRDTTVSLSLPNVVFNVSRIYPFRRKNASGRQRWYEKINMSYTGTLSNNVTVHEKELFTEDMFKKMRNGVQHRIPISTSMTFLKHFNLTMGGNYNERWYFRKIEKEFDSQTDRIVNADTTYGFHRLYNYDMSASATFNIYGMYDFSKNRDFPVQAIRHVITPSVSFNYTPDFGADKYGYYKPIQMDATGALTTYSPFEGEMYGIPGRGQSMAMGFSLKNTLEMKVRDRSDTTGTKKIKVIDELRASGSYNFLADSLNLSMIGLSLRVSNIVKNFGLNISASLDPYQVDRTTGRRINRLMIRDGKPGRIASTSWAWGYTFNSSKSATPAINDINSGAAMTSDPNSPVLQNMDPYLRRQFMTQQYYDFNIPWNFGFNYSLSYTNNGIRKNITQTLGFQGSVNLTPKWGITFNGGYDFQQKKLTPGSFNLTRDLHCWQMNFTWVPVGFIKQWSFEISVRSAMLKDLKYDKRNSPYDNLYD